MQLTVCIKNMTGISNHAKNIQRSFNFIEE